VRRLDAALVSGGLAPLKVVEYNPAIEGVLF
jgi:hypothetical protein